MVAGTTALAVNEGAFMSEIIRAGITSVDRGQMEAAQSVGMTRRLGMRRIVLPQAARLIEPPLGNEFNGMTKSTSLLAFIGVYERFLDAEGRLMTKLVAARQPRRLGGDRSRTPIAGASTRVARSAGGARTRGSHPRWGPWATSTTREIVGRRSAA